MKIEEFRIEGIPAGYQVFDVDLTDAGEPVATVGSATDATAPALAITAQGQFQLPMDSVFFMRDRGPWLGCLTRWAGNERLVVAQHRQEEPHDANCWVYRPDGTLECSFALGDDVEEILTNDRQIVALFGDEAPGGGMAVFDLSGGPVWVHGKHFPSGEKLAWWFHAASWIDDETIAVFGDVDSSTGSACRYFCIDLANRAQRILVPPDHVARPKGIAVSGDRVLEHGIWPGTDGPSDDIVAWDVSNNEVTKVGDYPNAGARKHPTLRGLKGGRFIAPTPTGYKIISFD